MRKHHLAAIMALVCVSLAMLPFACRAAETHREDLHQMEKSLPYRSVSFHRGRADKDLIKLSADIGFNECMIQLEGGTVGPLKDFAERNKTEHYIDFCHDLGMKATLWVHEFADIPGDIGPIEIGNQKLWSLLEDRYEWLFSELLPDIDGIVLTVVETQIDATKAELMIRIVEILREKCNKYDKSLVVRTFVHHPSQLEGVMGCVERLPQDTVIMTKCVPQDWQMRGVHNPVIGNVGGREQIIESDVAGEYFLKDQVANCMPQLLKEQFDYQVSKGVKGICVRVDRDDSQILHLPQEVNLYALGMFACGKTDSVAEVWNTWAEARFGKDAAAGVIKALKPTQQVITECLNVGSFSFGDTRFDPPNGDADAFHTNWSNWRWDESYLPEYKLAAAGDPQVIEKTKQQKSEALELAAQCLDDLELVKDTLEPADYDILRTKLFTNLVQLEYRAPMMLAYLRYKRILNTEDESQKRALAADIRTDVSKMREVAGRTYDQPRHINHRGSTWTVGAPGWFEPTVINEWVDKMETLLDE